MAGPSGDYLIHYGVKGMKWGRRKNRDGSVRSVRQIGRKTNNGAQDVSEDYAESRRIKAKPVSAMSNAELKKVNERLNLERNYQQLISGNKEDIKKGKLVWQGVSEGLKVLGVINQLASVDNTSTFRKGKQIYDFAQTKKKARGISDPMNG